MVLQKLKSRVHFFLKKVLFRVRYFFNKKHFAIPETAFDSDFKVHLASNSDDFEGAFKLLHDDAVQKKLFIPQPSGLMCPVHSVLPLTGTIVVKYKDIVIATAALIQDSKVGFYSEKFFANEIRELRQNQRQVHLEIAYVAIDKGFKKSTLTLIHLIVKYAICYAKKQLNFRSLIMSVNPALESYFSDFWQFERISPIIRYNSSMHSNLTLMQLNLSKESRRNYRRYIPSLKYHENPALFIARRDRRFKYPELPQGQIIYPVMTPKMLAQFCLKQSQVYEEFNLQTRQYFLEMYMQFYGFEQMQPFLNIESEIHIREYRLPIQTKVSIRSGAEYIHGIMRDLSSTGCYFEIPVGSLNQSEKVYLTFKIGELELNVHASPIWQNRNQHIRYGEGYGVKFDNPLLQISEEVKTWSTRLHNKAASSH